MMLGKKKKRAFFLSSKWVLKQQRHLLRPTMHLAQKLLMNVQGSDGSRSFAKETSLEGEERSGQPSDVGNAQLRAIIKADSLTNTRGVPEEISVDHSMAIQHLKQIGKVKNLSKWEPGELTGNKKNVILKCCLLLFCATTNHFSDCDGRQKSGFYMTTGNHQLGGWTEKKLQSTSQSQTCAKKRSWSLSGGLLPV